MAITLLTQIVLGIALMLIGGELSEATEKTVITLHTTVGYLFAAGLITRILWLFIGMPTARLGDMLPISKAKRAEFFSTIRYYLSFLKGDPPLYKAHNAFAGAIYTAFFLIASLQVVTGCLVLSLPEETQGAHNESLVQEMHEVGFYLIIGYIIAHVAAVVVHELVERRGLISGMVNGKKSFTDEEWKKFDNNGQP